MALTPAALTALSGALQGIFTVSIDGGTATSVAGEIGDAYQTYAAGATSCAGSIPTVVNLTGLKNGLKASMQNNQNSAAGSAAEWADAFDAYWTGAKFGAVGVVTIIGGATALKAALAPVFVNSANSAASAAAAIAAALDAYTRAITVSDVGPCSAPVV